MVDMLEKHFIVLNQIGRGESHATKRAELSALTGLKDRSVRSIISEMQIAGVCICNAQDGNGYFLPETKADVIAQIKQNDNRAKHLLAKQKHLKALLKTMEEEEMYGTSLI